MIYFGKKVVEEMHGLLEQARDAILQVKKDDEEQLAVEKGCIDSIRTQVTDLTGQLMKAKESLRTSSSKERTALTEVKKIDA